MSTFVMQAIGEYKASDVASSLKLRDYKDATDLVLNEEREVKSVVRRLTPEECERLQGFPDGWTDIGEWIDSKGKKHKEADSPRYKALGNSIAVGAANRHSGFWCWLMKRISAQYERDATLGSLFDGIGGFPLAWETYNGAGSARWASEIEEFPIAVTKKHFPQMKHLGDITKIHGDGVETVDVITGGSPCQDLSVAGKRAGLAGERSGLFMEQIRVVKEMREYDRNSGRTDGFIRPRYMVWENVPGAFSSGTPKGADFQAVLEETVRIVCKEAPPVSIPKDGWPAAGCITGVGDSGMPFSIAWRVHDAQHWGVPQRRKRIALVADFNGLSAPEILFVRQGLSGDSEQGREERQKTAGSSKRSADAAVVGYDGYNGALGSVVSTLGVNCGMSSGRNGVMISDEAVVAIDQGGGKSSVSISTEKSPTLSTTHDGAPAVCQVKPIVIEGNGSRKSHLGDGYKESDIMYTLNATEHHAVALENHPNDSRVKISEDGMVQTLSSRMGTGGGNVPMVMENGCDIQ